MSSQIKNNLIASASDEDKIKGFERLTALFYERNFGIASKSEIEMEAFCIFADIVEKSGTKRSEHEIAKSLGITDSKARSLIQKKRLTSDEVYNWKEELRSYLLKYDPPLYLKDDFIYISISDAFLRSEVCDVLEKAGVVVDGSFDSRIIKIPKDAYEVLLETVLDKKELAELETKVNEYCKSHNEQNKIGKVLDNIKKGTEIMGDVADIVTKVINLFSADKIIYKVVSLVAPK